MKIIVISSVILRASTTGTSGAAKGFGAKCGARNIWSYNMDNHPVIEANENTSIHGGHITEVHDVPIEVLIRAFPSELDENKVKSLMETIMVFH